MAKISLRAYVQEIDNLIEHNQLDAAIAHCRGILQTYPKHIDTYRLLGKAYLEAKRYGDAADIFQRVLSAIPDDFVSHIGMAIIREDEGNLDASIWHMERAFETNPANPAIQQELRRLIGRRDGIEPPKIRLTRGALARMYARGDLYPQAIAELRAALKNEPDRPDLQILLSEMYWRTDHPVEAAETSTDLLEKLPFCRNANRIMATVLHSKDKIEEAAVYHRRLAALDPYAALLESAMDDPKMLDETLIQLERLVWRPGQPLPEGEPDKPDWAETLSKELGTKPLEAAEITPAWLASVAPPADQEPAPEGGADEEALPFWMRDAGWAEQTGESSEGEDLPAAEEQPLAGVGDEEADLAPAEIPSWLKDIVPEPTDEPPEATPPTEATPEEESVPELHGEAPSEASQIQPDEAGELPSWLEETTPGATDTIVSWLSDRVGGEERPVAEAPDEVVPDVADGAPEEAADLTARREPPSWLSGVAEAAAQDEIPTEEEVAQLREGSGVDLPATPAPLGPDMAPEWLREIAEPVRDRPAEPPEPEPPLDMEPEPTPEEPAAPEDDWLADLRPGPDLSAEDPEHETDRLRPPAEVPPTPDITAPPSPSIEDSQTWLKELATAPISEERLPAPSMEMADETTPSEAEGPPEIEQVSPEAPTEDLQWLDRLSEERGIEIEPEPEPEPVTEEADDRQLKVPDWLREIVAETGELHEVDEAAAAPRADQVPEWLQQPEEVPDAPPLAAEPIPELPVIEAPPPDQPPPEEAEPVPIPEAPVFTEAIEKPAPPTSAPPEAMVPSSEELLLAARQAMDAGNLGRACTLYGKLIAKRQLLPETIGDLSAALVRSDTSPDLWLALGDAYMKTDNPTEAIEAYRRGMEVV
ncbi:MAG: tetratricopeptide repeat protein [Anaerolineales bacterium]|jgi:tetratricopeptide (TPR) repeat protein